LPHTPVHSPQDMLARITREITASEDLQAVLSSVVTALASQGSRRADARRRDQGL